MGPNVRTIRILGQEVDETKLRDTLRDVLKLRGVSAEIIVRPRVEEIKPQAGGSLQPEPAVGYKYAFFDCLG